MTTREALHELVDQLRDDRAELARTWLEDLLDAVARASPHSEQHNLNLTCFRAAGHF